MTGLKRPRHPMPTFVRTALAQHRLLQAYAARPSHQRNDYLGWIMRGALSATRERRLRQLLDELERGDVYMKMKWSPRRDS